MNRLFLAALPFLIAGCATGGPPSTVPAIDIESDSLNTVVRVLAPTGWSSFKTNDEIGLAIDVTGSEDVAFPPDFGTRMFMYDATGWIEVEGVPSDEGGARYVLSPSGGDPLLATATTVFPILPDASSRVLLRIFVIGNVYRNGQMTDEMVGAYVDVELSP